MNVPIEGATRDRGDTDPERLNPVPLGTGMLIAPEVAALALAAQQKTPAPLDAGVMATPEAVNAAANPV